MDALLDEILRLILDRIDSPVSLVRAAATCKRWLRIIGCPGFLRRFRTAYAPTMVAGDYFNDTTLLSSLMAPKVPRTRGIITSSSIEAQKTRDRPSFVPAPSSSIDVGKFSLDFLPTDVRFPRAWTVSDSRGSLLLVNRTRCGQFTDGFPDMFICEPATRRYKRILPPPDFPGIWDLDKDCFETAFLVDGDTDATGSRIGMSNFKVLCVFNDLFSRRAATFAAGPGTSSSWSDEAPTIDHGLVDAQAIVPDYTRPLGLARGSWFFQHFYAGSSDNVIVLDAGTGEFSRSPLSFSSESSVDFNYSSSSFYVADGRDDKPRIVAVFDETLRVFTRLDGGMWALEKSIVLSQATHGLPGWNMSFFEMPLNILTRGPGFVILSPQTVERWLVSVDLETMEVELVEEDMGTMVYRCELPWPPALNMGIDNK